MARSPFWPALVINHHISYTSLGKRSANLSSRAARTAAINHNCAGLFQAADIKFGSRRSIVQSGSGNVDCSLDVSGIVKAWRSCVYNYGFSVVEDLNGVGQADVLVRRQRRCLLRQVAPCIIQSRETARYEDA